MAAPRVSPSKASVTHGETHQFDSSFKGPTSKRKCTDVFCCFIFILVILTYLGLGAVAWIHVDLRKLLHPTDSYGWSCGEEGTSNANKPFLFYFNILKCSNPSLMLSLHCPTPQVCVSQCPQSFFSLAEVQLNISSWSFYRNFCRPGFNQPEKSLSDLLADEDCPSFIMPSTPGWLPYPSSSCWLLFDV
ncbi:choline transporter-like protein 5 [Gouania willdenowi]|uniref:choline transporter-like protein 5 n=1 Tax=Gouania willdenowi TaxID=441366 RepID=UPI0010555793|nr:choline transporter-like protein 5 [Gouania willdenowi]